MLDSYMSPCSHYVLLKTHEMCNELISNTLTISTGNENYIDTIHDIFCRIFLVRLENDNFLTIFIKLFF